MSGIALRPSLSRTARASSLVRPCDGMSRIGVTVFSDDEGATMLLALTVRHLNCRSRYHHSIERLEGVFGSRSGLAERRSKSGHCTSLTRSDEHTSELQ